MSPEIFKKLEEKGYVLGPEGYSHRSRLRPVEAPKPQPDQGGQIQDRDLVGRKKSRRKADRGKSNAPIRNGSGVCRVVVTIIQLRRRLLDNHDNLRASLKSFVDYIAAQLGVPDNDPRIVWEYGQNQTRGQEGVLVRVSVEGNL